MTRYRRLLWTAALVGLSLTGCPVVVHRVPPPGPPPFEKPATEPPSTTCRRTEFDVDGTYVHAATKIEFPDAVAGWTRSTLTQYDIERNDVGIGYGRTVGGNRVELTLYVFPRLWNSATEPMMPAEEFEGECGEIRARYADIVDGPRSAGTAPFRGGGAPGYSIEMTMPNPGLFASGRLVTWLTTYAFEPWRLKYRITAEDAHRPAVRAAIDAALTELHLPPLVPTEAAAPEGRRR